MAQALLAQYSSARPCIGASEPKIPAGGSVKPRPNCKKDVSEGIATIRLAYGLDPALAGVPIDRSLFGSGLRLRQMVRKVVRVANDENSSSAWLAVVVFMQAEGRDAVALKNLAKAEREYLSEDIARALRRELE